MTAVSQRSNVIIGAVVFATVATVFPGFLIGAIAVQVREEFAITEAQYAWGLSSFFLAAAAGSVVLGRAAQRFGPKRQTIAALCVSVLAQLFIAIGAQSFTAIVAALAVTGFVNAANQTAANLLLSQAELPRLGLAIAIKQSAMPAAAVLSGLAVPVVALTAGWRATYLLGVGMAVAGIFVVWRLIPSVLVDTRAALPAPRSTRSDLITAGVSGGFLAFAAGAMTSWLVSSAVDVGVGPGAAGLLLSMGSICGIAVRLAWGFQLDRLNKPFKWAAALSTIGGFGMAALAIDSPLTHVVATVVAFGGGWVWPVFTNYGIVRTNADAAGRATGITQMGVYLGVFSAPLVTGQLIEHYGYATMWLVVAATSALGAATTFALKDRF